MEQLSSPIVAAVNGYCLGGGFEFALACDFILASENAKIGLPEVSLGLIPGWGGTQRLARLVGANRARQMIYSAEKITAQQALNWGIVNAVYPQGDLMAKARGLLLTCAQNSPFAVSQAKRSLNEGLQVDIDRGLTLEQTYFGLCFSSEDLKEGVAAFSEKRKPDFKGR
jgi:enoyl-CoA hydratase